MLCRRIGSRLLGDVIEDRLRDYVAQCVVAMAKLFSNAICKSMVSLFGVMTPPLVPLNNTNVASMPLSLTVAQDISNNTSWLQNHFSNVQIAAEVANTRSSRSLSIRTLSTPYGTLSRSVHRILPNQTLVVC